MAEIQKESAALKPEQQRGLAAFLTVTRSACRIRLANRDAIRLPKLIRPGTTVEVR